MTVVAVENCILWQEVALQSGLTSRTFEIRHLRSCCKSCGLQPAEINHINGNCAATFKAVIVVLHPSDQMEENKLDQSRYHSSIFGVNIKNTVVRIL